MQSLEESKQLNLTDKDINQIKKQALTTCAWCAARLPERELAEYERHVKEPHKPSDVRGWYVCVRCVNWMDNLIQQKVVHTWMVMKARNEKSCCGGGG